MSALIPFLGLRVLYGRPIKEGLLSVDPNHFSFLLERRDLGSGTDSTSLLN